MDEKMRKKKHSRHIPRLRHKITLSPFDRMQHSMDLQAHIAANTDDFTEMTDRFFRTFK